MKRLDGIMREYYLEYVNNWLSVDSFASHHEIPAYQMRELLEIGRALHEHHVELCKSIKALQEET